MRDSVVEKSLQFIMRMKVKKQPLLYVRITFALSFPDTSSELQMRHMY